jgi:hypothetical protein
LDSTWNEADE